MFDDEYKERAYQQYKRIWGEGEGKLPSAREIVAEILDVDAKELEQGFIERYESEKHDSLEKIREDVEKVSVLLQDGDDVGTFVHIAKVESLINRTIAVMERKNE